MRTSDRLVVFFIVKGRQNLEEHKEQIPRNPKHLWKMLASPSERALTVHHSH